MAVIFIIFPMCCKNDALLCGGHRILYEVIRKDNNFFC